MFCNISIVNEYIHYINSTNVKHISIQSPVLNATHNWTTFKANLQENENFFNKKSSQNTKKFPLSCIENKERVGEGYSLEVHYANT